MIARSIIGLDSDGIGSRIACCRSINANRGNRMGGRHREPRRNLNIVSAVITEKI